MPVIALATLVVLAAGYLLYGRRLAQAYALDDAHPPPSVTHADGVDFVATPRFYLLGQHFSAIAAAGPIAGPIIACQLFGWAPSLIWIALGAVFIGAVHDFSSLVASVRHGAANVAEVLREHVGQRAWVAMMAFIWLALIYVLVAFADITAGTFVGNTEDLPSGVAFNRGGAVAMASTLYLGLAIVMGVIDRLWKPPLWLLTVVFVPATLAAVWAGTLLSTVLVFGQISWGLTILAYCFAAALLPVWLLLQPRGYLGGFVLYLALAVGVIGLFFGGFDIKQPAFGALDGPKLTDAMFPFLFVTIACGACSGFHGLVCSGTTSKQIAAESHCRSVGYGGMLLEAFVALVALGTVMMLAPSEVGGRSPGRIYGDGLGQFMALVLGDERRVFAATFGAMAFSTFVFDTLDVATRLGRYVLQELVRVRTRVSGVLATAITAGVPAALVAGAQPGPGQPPTYMLFWTLFGTANQLLAALTLMAITVWLKRTGRSVRYTLPPMVFVLVMTVWSLLLQVHDAFSQPLGFNARTGNGFVGAALLALAAYIAFACWRAVTLPRVAETA